MIISREKYNNLSNLVDAQRDLINALDKKIDALEEQKRGEWLWSPRDADGTVSGCCSKCSFSHLLIGGHTAQYNFCPNCGARMKGAGDES